MRAAERRHACSRCCAAGDTACCSAAMRMAPDRCTRSPAAVGDAYGDLIDVHIVAPSGTVRDAYAVRAPTGIVIRPDGYIGYYGQPIDRARLLAHLASYLVSLEGGAPSPPGRGGAG